MENYTEERGGDFALFSAAAFRSFPRMSQDVVYFFEARD